MNRVKRKNVGLEYKIDLGNMIEDYMERKFVSPAKSYLSLDHVFSTVARGLDIPVNKLLKQSVIAFFMHNGFEFIDVDGYKYVKNIGHPYEKC